MSYDQFKRAVQGQIRFWTGSVRDDDVVEANCREAYGLGMRVEQTARDIQFNE